MDVLLLPAQTAMAGLAFSPAIAVLVFLKIGLKIKMNRQPRAYVVVNGTNIYPISVTIVLSRTKDADTCAATLPLGDGSSAAPPLSFYAGLTAPVSTQVFMSNNGNAFVKMFDGYLDQFVFALGLEMRIELTGRDKAQQLADTKVQKAYLNQTPQQIVQTVAQSAGLQVNAAGLSAFAGKIWQIDFNKFFQNHSLWTGVHNLADLFGLNAYITQGTLYLQDVNESLPSYNVTYSPPSPQQYARGDFMDLKITNIPLAQKVQINVRSWDNKKKKLNSSQAGTSGGLVYSYDRPMLQTDQTQRIANKKLAEATAHKLSLAISMPGDTALTARNSIQLSGTQGFDGAYNVDSVEHRMDLSQGYRMEIVAKTPGDEGSGTGSEVTQEEAQAEAADEAAAAKQDQPGGPSQGPPTPDNFPGQP